MEALFNIFLGKWFDTFQNEISAQLLLEHLSQDVLLYKLHRSWPPYRHFYIHQLIVTLSPLIGEVNNNDYFFIRAPATGWDVLGSKLTFYHQIMKHTDLSKKRFRFRASSNLEILWLFPVCSGWYLSAVSQGLLDCQVSIAFFTKHLCHKMA